MEFVDPIANYQDYINASYTIVIASLCLSVAALWWEQRRLNRQLDIAKGDLP